MKTLTTFNLFRDLNGLQSGLNTFFHGFPIRFPTNGKALWMPDWAPLVDITENDQEYLFKADLPEMKKDDVKVTVENGILSISGDRKTEKEEKKIKFHRLERFFGSFKRTFTVPEDANTTKIVAEFRDGVLHVHLPKTATAKPKPIEVKVQ